MAEKPPIPASSVSFGGFEAKGDRVFLRFHFLNDYRPVGELTYEIPSGPTDRTRRLIRAHTQIEKCLRELMHVNAAMLESIIRAADHDLDNDTEDADENI